jgi:sarcosine/dimethylglycine N-methyltransferase
VGFVQRDYTDRTPQLVKHYSRVLQETENRSRELLSTVSAAYVERMKAGLRHWIDGGRRGYLAWGIFHFRKP